MLEAVLPTMIAQVGSHVVNVPSVAGRRVVPGRAVYSATKFAVRALSGWRQELGPAHGIRVTCVEPGAVATELGQHIADEDALADSADFFARITPMEAERIAEAIVYAVSAPEGTTTHRGARDAGLRDGATGRRVPVSSGVRYPSASKKARAWYPTRVADKR